MTVYSSSKEVYENALIYLYLEVSSSSRYVTIERRTQLLKTFIKPLITKPELKGLKKELKQLCLTKNTVSLEFKLVELLDKLSGAMAKRVEVERELFDFLADLYVATGLDIQVSNKSRAAKPGTIYILDDEISKKISNSGQYKEPICLYIYFTEKMPCKTFLAACAEDTRFICRVKHSVDDHACIEVLPSLT